uniref:Glycosyltransferase family 92 protein n=1 Tax=Glossina pallidipes TaxID=7398 RepID=A0A1B0A9G3_GLOPL
MRKYQQLLLLIISCISVGILLMYKTENNRLKDVLHVINFFGRKDAAILRRIDNINNSSHYLADFIHPLPVWQQFGQHFHAYAAYWKRNELVAGGEAVVIVVGGRGAILNFKCSVNYEANKMPNVAKPISICLDLVNQAYKNATSLEHREKELMQFFVHHFSLGIEDFIVYNGDDLSLQLLLILDRLNIKVHLLPFNFPYSHSNDIERIRSLVETDCLLRNTNRARHTLLLTANEFFYPSTKLYEEKSVLKYLSHYTSKAQRFELPVFAVCKDQTHNFLIDNTLYDPEVKFKHHLYVYRLSPNILNSSTEDLTTSSSTLLTVNRAFIHHYCSCLHVGKDGLFDWRNSIREDFMKHLQSLKNELKIYI